MAIPPIPSLKREFDSITTSLTGSGTGAGGAGLVRKPLAATPSPATPSPRPALAAAPTPTPSLSMPPRPALGAPMASPATATSRPTPSTGGAFSAITKPLGAGVNLARGAIGAAQAPPPLAATPRPVSAAPPAPVPSATGAPAAGMPLVRMPLLGLSGPAPAAAPTRSLGQFIGENVRDAMAQRNAASAQAGRALRAAGTAIGNFAGDVQSGYTGQPNVIYNQAESFITPEQRAASLARGDLTSRPVPAASPATATPTAAAPPAAARFQGMNTLTVRPGMTTSDGTTSISGRPIPYGATINGVRTYSDGSGSVPATMGVSDLAQLARGERLTTIPSGAAPAFGPNGSFVAESGGTVLSRGAAPAGYSGGQARPQPNAAAGSDVAANLYRPQRPILPAQAGPSPLELQRYAASDAAAIASGDPRSSLGIAARNLRSQMQYGTRAERAAAAKQLEALSGGVQRGYEQNADLAQRNAAEALRAATELERASIGADSAQQVARITRPRPQFDRVTLDDGRVAMVGEDGSSRFATAPDGQVLRTSLPRQATLSPADRTKAITETAVAMAGQGALTEDTYRKAAALVDGGGSTVPEGAVAALRQNPNLKADFEAKYGAGSAAQYLGG